MVTSPPRRGAQAAHREEVPLTRLALVAAALAAGTGGAAWAQTSGQPAAAPPPVVITVAEYQRLQAQQVPASEIGMICRCARMTGRTPEEILAMRRAGRSWSEICAEFAIAPAAIQGPVYVAMPIEQMAGAPPATPTAPMVTTTPTINPYPSYQRPLPDAAWSRTYRLTPADYRRLRAMGFSRREVFFIANAADQSGRPPEEIAQMFYRGMPPHMIAEELVLRMSRLNRVHPEWRTPEWAAAVGESAPYPRDTLGFD